MGRLVPLTVDDITLEIVLDLIVDGLREDHHRRIARPLLFGKPADRQPDAILDVGIGLAGDLRSRDPIQIAVRREIIVHLRRSPPLVVCRRVGNLHDLKRIVAGRNGGNQFTAVIDTLTAAHTALTGHRPPVFAHRYAHVTGVYDQSALGIALIVNGNGDLGDGTAVLLGRESDYGILLCRNRVFRVLSVGIVVLETDRIVVRARQCRNRHPRSGFVRQNTELGTCVVDLQRDRCLDRRSNIPALDEQRILRIDHLAALILHDQGRRSLARPRDLVNHLRLTAHRHCNLSDIVLLGILVVIRNADRNRLVARFAADRGLHEIPVHETAPTGVAGQFPLRIGGERQSPVLPGIDRYRILLGKRHIARAVVVAIAVRATADAQRHRQHRRPGHHPAYHSIQRFHSRIIFMINIPVPSVFRPRRR